MSKALGESNTEPKNFMVIFEVRCFTVLVLDAIITYYVQRGIDPHVDEPDHCHVRIYLPQSSTDAMLIYRSLTQKSPKQMKIGPS